MVAAAVVASAVSARAVQDDVNLVGGWGISWNGQGTSPSQDIKIYDNTTPANGVFDGYELGLIFQRVSGSGELALNSALNPTSNSIVGSWSTTPAPTVTAQSNLATTTDLMLYIVGAAIAIIIAIAIVGVLMLRKRP